MAPLFMKAGADALDVSAANQDTDSGVTRLPFSRWGYRPFS